MIFGTTNPKFVSGVNTVNLEYSHLDPAFLIPAEIMHESVLTGFRSFVNSNDFARFGVMIYLWKYPNPVTKFEELQTYKNTTVFFYPHSDGDPIWDVDGNDEANFNIKSVTGYYLNDIVDYAVCVVTFEALEHILIEDKRTVITTEGGITLTTEDGDELIIE